MGISVREYAFVYRTSLIVYTLNREMEINMAPTANLFPIWQKTISTCYGIL